MNAPPPGPAHRSRRKARRVKSRQTVRSRHYALHQYPDGRLEIEALSTGSVMPLRAADLDLIMCESYIDAMHAINNQLDDDEPAWPAPPWETD